MFENELVSSLGPPRAAEHAPGKPALPFPHPALIVACRRSFIFRSETHKSQKPVSLKRATQGIIVARELDSPLEP